MSISINKDLAESSNLILFDLDGTIINSETKNLQKFKYIDKNYCLSQLICKIIWKPSNLIHPLNIIKKILMLLSAKLNIFKIIRIILLNKRLVWDIQDGKSFSFIPDIMTGLLSKGFKLGIATNRSVLPISLKEKLLKIGFSLFLTSKDIGVKKPNPRFIEYLEQNYNPICYIGDSWIDAELRRYTLLPILIVNYSIFCKSVLFGKTKYKNVSKFLVKNNLAELNRLIYLI